MDIKLGKRYQLSKGNGYDYLPIWRQEPNIPAPKDVVLTELDLRTKPVVVLLVSMNVEIEKSNAPIPSEFWCKILTTDGIVGWAYCGGVEFKEI